MRRGVSEPGQGVAPKGDLDRAIADFTDAIRLGRKQSAFIPAFPDAIDAIGAEGLQSRADTFMEKKDLARAIADYSQIIEKTPWDSQALCGRATLVST